MKMCLRMKRKYVRYFNHNGFTMLEMLFAFSIFLLIISFFPVTMKFLMDHDQLEARTKRMEWHVFVNQLKKEMRLAEGLAVTNSNIVLKKHGQGILYEKYGANLRRRVDYRGHEIVFQGVKSFQFSPLHDGVRLTLTDIYNQSYSVSLYSYISMDNDHD